MTLLVPGALRVDVMGVGADDDRNRFQTGLPGATQSLGAKEDAIATLFGSMARNDQLKDSVQNHVLGELGDFFIEELGSRVARVFLKAVNWTALDPILAPEGLEERLARRGRPIGTRTIVGGRPYSFPGGAIHARQSRVRV